MPFPETPGRTSHYLHFPRAATERGLWDTSSKSQVTASCVPMMNFPREALWRQQRWFGYRITITFRMSLFCPLCLPHVPAVWGLSLCTDIADGPSASSLHFLTRCHNLASPSTHLAFISHPVNYLFSFSLRNLEWMWSLATWFHKYLKSWLLWFFPEWNHLVGLVWSVTMLALLTQDRIDL